MGQFGKKMVVFYTHFNWENIHSQPVCGGEKQDILEREFYAQIINRSCVQVSGNTVMIYNLCQSQNRAVLVGRMSPKK